MMSRSIEICYNDDVWMEILVRVPAKSLIKLKCVCKHWLSLISSNQFCYLHTLRDPKPQPSLILHANETSQYFYFDPFDGNPHKQLIPYTFTIPNPKILSSCNGLLLLESEKSYYVYNPTTNQSRKITLTVSDKHPNVLGLNLAFDPWVSPRYKIVCVKAAKEPAAGGGRCCQVELYDSQSRTWKLCVEGFTDKFNANFASGVYLKNVIHWERGSFTPLYFDTNKHDIRDLPDVVEIPDSIGSRRMVAIPYTVGSIPVVPDFWHLLDGVVIPDMPVVEISDSDLLTHIVVSWGGVGGVDDSCQLQESNGCLYYLLTYSDYGEDFHDASIHVYSLKEDYSEWVIEHLDVFDGFPDHFRILNFKRGSVGETCTAVAHVPGKILLYRFDNKSFEELIDLTDQPFYQEDSLQFYPTNVHPFGESMAPV